MRHEYADVALPVILLRTRRERPSSHRATEKGDEFTPPHRSLRG
jgi:hypothetical protein